MKVLQKLNEISDKMFTNKIFLYFMFFVAVLQVVFFIDSRKFNALFFFIAFGIILRQFTFNNATVIFVALLMTNAFIHMSSALEGMSGFRGTRNRYKQSEITDEDRFEKFKQRLRNHRNKYQVAEEEEEEETQENIKNIESFSKIKSSKRPQQSKSFSASSLPISRSKHPHTINNNENVARYNQIKDKYKDLVATIRQKTASIKALSNKIRV
jgi:hypothetical protein